MAILLPGLERRGHYGFLSRMSITVFIIYLEILIRLMHAMSNNVKVQHIVPSEQYQNQT